MTKEEAVKALADIIFDVAREGYIPFDVEDERCAKSIAIERINDFYPTLPSNLDDAAFEYENTLWEKGRGYCPQDICDAFKAGAEWITGQGVSVDASVVSYDDGLGLNMSDEDVLSGIFKDGDKVIVQIKKK